MRNLVTELVYIAGIIFTCVFLYACASTPPSKTLPESEIAVKSISHSNFEKLVGPDVIDVQQKLVQAKQATSNNENQLAEHLAQQILVDVELIKVKSQRILSDQELSELEASIVNLNHELQWRSPINVAPLKE